MECGNYGTHMPRFTVSDGCHMSWNRRVSIAAIGAPNENPLGDLFCAIDTRTFRVRRYTGKIRFTLYTAVFL
jgi:hypothetical protein